jgi:hypothetical protein
MTKTAPPSARRDFTVITTANSNSLPAHLRPLFGGKIRTMEKSFILKVAQ